MLILKKKCKLIAADSFAIQQIIFAGNIAAAADNARVIIYILEQSKETMLGFFKGTAKVL